MNFSKEFQQKKQKQQMCDLSEAQILAIEEHHSTKRIDYDDEDIKEVYKEAYDYVMDRFPSCADRIREVPILETSRKVLQDTGRAMGVDSAAGFFVPAFNVLVVSRPIKKPNYVAFTPAQKVSLKLHRMQETSDPPIEVIMVHELLHCASKLMRGTRTNRVAEENFAYTETIPYLRDRNWTDEEIADEYLNVWAHQSVFGNGQYFRSKLDKEGLTDAQYNVKTGAEQSRITLKILTENKEEMKEMRRKYAYKMIGDFDLKQGNMSDISAESSDDEDDRFEHIDLDL